MFSCPHSPAPTAPSQHQLLDGTPLEIEIIPAMVKGIWCDDPIMQLEATTRFRKLLSIESSPPINEVIKAGVIPRFVKFLARQDMPQLQFEAAWALTNVASGTSEHTRFVIEQDAVPMFWQLLSSDNDDVREQALWALGNVAGDSPCCRDLVLGQGALQPLLCQLIFPSNLSILRNAYWTLSNFIRGLATPFWAWVKPILSFISEQLYNHLCYGKDEVEDEVLTDICWALSSFTDGPNENNEAVIEAGLCWPLVRLMCHPSHMVCIPALRTVGNIVTRDDCQTQSVIANGGLPRLCQLLDQSNKKSIKKEACWTISNITAGNETQIQAVIVAGIIPPLVELLQHADLDIKMEAAYAISNAISGGSTEQIRYLVAKGCIEPLCDILICCDPRILTVCLEAVEHILNIGEADREKGLNNGVNRYAEMVGYCGGSWTIQDLKIYEDPVICVKAAKIFDRYWSEENFIDRMFGSVSPPCPSAEEAKEAINRKRRKEPAPWLLETGWARRDIKFHKMPDSKKILSLNAYLGDKPTMKRRKATKSHTAATKSDSIDARLNYYKGNYAYDGVIMDIVQVCDPKEIIAQIHFPTLCENKINLIVEPLSKVGAPRDAYEVAWNELRKFLEVAENVDLIFDHNLPVCLDIYDITKIDRPLDRPSWEESHPHVSFVGDEYLQKLNWC